MASRTNTIAGAMRPAGGKGSVARSPDREAAVPPARSESRQEIDTREQRLFQSLDLDNDQQVLRSDVVLRQNFRHS